MEKIDQLKLMDNVSEKYESFKSEYKKLQDISVPDAQLGGEERK